MKNQQDVPAFETYRAMTVVSYVAAAVAKLSQGQSVVVEHIMLLTGKQSTEKQLHSAIHRTAPPGSTFTVRTVAEGVRVYRTC